MNLFGNIISELREYVEIIQERTTSQVKLARDISPWPSLAKGNIVMQADTAVELGNPRDESVSFLLWTNDRNQVADGRITLIGPDIGESVGRSLSFGKILLLGVKEFNADNCYERHKDIERIRYDLNLAGYMMRAVSQEMREWSRISRKAATDGFSLFTLGAALMEKYRSLEYVTSAEMFFVTSGKEDLLALKNIGERTTELIGAMNKLANEHIEDCGSCDYTELCSEVEGLRSIKKERKEGTQHV